METYDTRTSAPAILHPPLACFNLIRDIVANLLNPASLPCPSPSPPSRPSPDRGEIADALQNASSRLTLKADDLGFPNALLSLTSLRYPDDAGDYCCHAENVANTAVGCTIVRVKGEVRVLQLGGGGGRSSWEGEQCFRWVRYFYLGFSQ